jgi:hypothetical protein
MKLPMPTAQEIYNIACRAEEVTYISKSRLADRMAIENAIRQALALVVDRLDIQITTPLSVDLSKPQ